MRLFSEKLEDKVESCITVGVEQTIEAGIFLIRIKMSQKIFEQKHIFFRKLNFFFKLRNTLLKIPK